MAGLLVGGWFASAFIAKLADNLRLYISSQYSYQTGTKSLMKKLERRLREILAVLYEADRRMVENPHLIDWLRDLKDAAFDAEDALDRFEYQLLRRQAKGEGQQLQRYFAPAATVVKRLAFRDADLNELGDVVKRFDQLVAEKDTFLRFLEQAAECKPAEIMQLRVRTSVPTEPDLIGREAEKGRLIGMLLSANNESGFRKKVNIVPIVGIGGVGKTTLAQFIYNDVRVKSFFDITAWVCVSDNFDVRIIMSKIVESASIQRPTDFFQIQNEDVIQKILIGGLKGRKFLIILDDIWNEDSSRWEMLKASFEFGKEGSWVVVTTRDTRIADMMRTVPTVALDGLSGDDFWNFFQKCAFGDAHPEDHPELESLGREIAYKRLRGSPLAAKTVGAVLQSKLEWGHWREIINSKLWNVEQGRDGILPVLKVSYSYLPAHLKQCFVYCSLFPKDFIFEKEGLVRIWMAQGFITQPEMNEEKTIESIGESYFHELLSRSFFQSVQQKFWQELKTMESIGESYFRNPYYVIHDLLHDLAQSVSANEYVTVEDGKKDIPRKVLHLFVEGRNLKMSCEGIPVKKRLRSLVISGHLDVDMLSDCLQELKGLRVLIIHGRLRIENFPDCFAQLIHLRYLELNMLIGRLPKSLCKLCHLQGLHLHWTSKEDSPIVPQGFSKLRKLRYLRARSDTVSQFGELRFLQKVEDYYVSKDSDLGITQLKNMNQIRGKLRIWNLENVVDELMASEANLKNKMRLDRLTLNWGRSSHVKAEEVLETLQPYKDLQALKIVGYPGTKYPSWFLTNCLSNILAVELSDCYHLKSLPRLGHLPLLRSLTLENLPKITKIGAEIYRVGRGIAFPSLRTLLIKDMHELQEWEDLGSYQVVYPYLTSLFIGNCPKFRSFGGPIVLPSSLKKLGLNQYDVYPPKRLTDQSTLEITIQDIGSYQAVYPYLRREWFPVHSLSCLEELTMPRRVLELFPTEWFQQLYTVRRLQLFGCHTVCSLHVGVRSFPSLEVLILLDCFDILSLTDNDLPSSLKELHIKHYQPTDHPPRDVIQCSGVQTITVEMQQATSSYVVEDDSMVKKIWDQFLLWRRGGYHLS